MKERMENLISLVDIAKERYRGIAYLKEADRNSRKRSSTLVFVIRTALTDLNLLRIFHASDSIFCNGFNFWLDIS